jgi:hypothetical protein
MERRPVAAPKDLKRTWPLRKNGTSSLWTRVRSVKGMGVSFLGYI